MARNPEARSVHQPGGAHAATLRRGPPTQVGHRHTLLRGQLGSEALARALGARPVREKTLYGFSESSIQGDIHEAMLGETRVVLVPRCLWGGPQTAILVEELACLG